GNVSLYNENPAGVVDPTPTIAMVGLIDDEKHITTQRFKNHGDVIILVGTVVPRGRGDACAGINDPGYNLGGSSYLKVCHGLKVGPPPHIDLAHEIKVEDKKFAWPVADLFDDWWNSVRRVVESDSSVERIPSL